MLFVYSRNLVCNFLFLSTLSRIDTYGGPTGNRILRVRFAKPDSSPEVGPRRDIVVLSAVVAPSTSPSPRSASSRRPSTATRRRAPSCPHSRTCCAPSSDCRGACPAPCGCNRTPRSWSRRILLSRVETTRIERATLGLRSRCSPIELRPLKYSTRGGGRTRDLRRVGPALSH